MPLVCERVHANALTRILSFCPCCSFGVLIVVSSLKTRACGASAPAPAFGRNSMLLPLELAGDAAAAAAVASAVGAAAADAAAGSAASCGCCSAAPLLNAARRSSMAARFSARLDVTSSVSSGASFRLRFTRSSRPFEGGGGEAAASMLRDSADPPPPLPLPLLVAALSACAGADAAAGAVMPPPL